MMDMPIWIAEAVDPSIKAKAENMGLPLTPYPVDAQVIVYDPTRISEERRSDVCAKYHKLLSKGRRGGVLVEVGWLEACMKHNKVFKVMCWRVHVEETEVEGNEDRAGR